MIVYKIYIIVNHHSKKRKCFRVKFFERAKITRWQWCDADNFMTVFNY